MGMVLCLRTISGSTLKELLADPESVLDLLDEEGVEDDGNVSDEGTSIDLDKAWQAIHYLLTGTAEAGQWPSSFLLVGGTLVGDVEVGYGPARGLTARETSEVASLLSKTPSALLASRFDGKKMDSAEIYPQIWTRDGKDGLDYIVEYYAQLQSFVADAARKGMGLLVYIS